MAESSCRSPEGQVCSSHSVLCPFNTAGQSHGLPQVPGWYVGSLIEDKSDT